jgi:sulfite exporter TauE/SafE
MEIEYVSLFLIGLTGGFGHCIGMCSGFVFTYTLKISEQESHTKRNRWRLLTPHLLYNSGRVLTYTFLGELFALLGSTLGFMLAMKDFQGILEITAGLFMIIIGLEYSGLLPVSDRIFFPGLNVFKKAVQNMLNRVNRRNVFAVGLVLGFIPCGLVYAAGAKAAATQSLVGGMLTMLVFGLGTFPAMILMGLASHLISGKLRHRLMRVAAILVILLAIMTILRGIKAILH